MLFPLLMHFPWLILVCALTREPTHNPGALRRCSNQLATGPGPRAAFLGTPVTPPHPLVVPVQLGALTHSLDFHPASSLLFSGCIPGHLRECGCSTHCTPRLLLGWSRRGWAGGGAQPVLCRELSPAHISSLRPTCPTPPTQAPLAVPLAPLVLKPNHAAALPFPMWEARHRGGTPPSGVPRGQSPGLLFPPAWNDRSQLGSSWAPRPCPGLLSSPARAQLLCWDSREAVLHVCCE